MIITNHVVARIAETLSQTSTSCAPGPMPPDTAAASARAHSKTHWSMKGYD